MRIIVGSGWQTGVMAVLPVVPKPDHDAPGTVHEPCVLLKLGEIVLKGRNRQQFERLLQDNIRRAVRDLGAEVRVWQREGVIVLRVAGAEGGGLVAETAVDMVAERMRYVMGLARVCRAVRVAKEPEAAVQAAVELAVGWPGSFAVRARRRDKRFPVTSAELAVQIGRRIQQEYGYPVNLRTPDTTVYVEVDQREVFVFTAGLGRAGRTSCRHERPCSGADVRRHRLACRRVPDDAAGAAVQLPALLRHAADRTGVGVQGLRAGPPA